MITDVIGTPTHLVEADGRLSWWSRADLWGRASETAATPLRFPGQYLDTETGLHYNRFRYYDPATARYLSPDPLGLASGPDPTAYVSDPLTLADPLGLATCTPSQPSLNPLDLTGQPRPLPPQGPSQLPSAPLPPSPHAPSSGNWLAGTNTTSADLVRVSSAQNVTLQDSQQAMQPLPDQQPRNDDFLHLGEQLNPTPDMIVPRGEGKPDRLQPYEPYELKPIRLPSGEYVNLTVRNVEGRWWRAVDKGQLVGPRLSEVNNTDTNEGDPETVLTTSSRNITGGMRSSRSNGRSDRSGRYRQNHSRNVSDPPEIVANWAPSGITLYRDQRRHIAARIIAETLSEVPGAFVIHLHEERAMGVAWYDSHEGLDQISQWASGSQQFDAARAIVLTACTTGDDGNPVSSFGPELLSISINGSYFRFLRAEYTETTSYRLMSSRPEEWNDLTILTETLIQISVLEHI
ncbi:RHS repeat-associated core domain-containing protein [Actinoplanes sp. NBRC 103695]|uniref:RHS repeat-associated core domain-containing protein n=1 Tax=Actinoplanes sp. NBRC 103695 TaxID=3032202 RepID=UPI0024A03190|nr:RHS repeat-associated core domain-containing protein [Actinoplanes sp. NBRC 103695]GLZ01765.1 hypothetical protein Acsp02_90160 [Actinoplanes sp. NBRC 103695]